MSGAYSVPFYNDKKLSASAAFLLHAAFFLVGGAVFTQSAEYGIELGEGGIEVHLTAAPAYIEAPETVEPLTKEETVIIDKTAVSEEAAMPLPQQVVPEVRGDGRSPAPGKDLTTLHTAGGAMTEAKPNYLKNPVPRYPEEARRAAQQGLVMLTVLINEKGSAESVVLQASSGHVSLDQAALKAVKNWKFKPARIGSVAVRSEVKIPIRFELDTASAR